MSKPKPNAVFGVRTDYRSLATIFHHYKRLGIKVESFSSLCRMGLDDFARVLVSNKLSPEFKNLAEAIEFCGSLRKQKSHAHKNRQEVASQLSMDEPSVFDEVAGLSDEEFERIIKEQEGE